MRVSRDLLRPDRPSRYGGSPPPARRHPSRVSRPSHLEDELAHAACIAAVTGVPANIASTITRPEGFGRRGAMRDEHRRPPSASSGRPRGREKSAVGDAELIASARNRVVLMFVEQRAAGDHARAPEIRASRAGRCPDPSTSSRARTCDERRAVGRIFVAIAAMRAGSAVCRFTSSRSIPEYTTLMPSRRPPARSHSRKDSRRRPRRDPR